jgi:hypothetical protein
MALERGGFDAGVAELMGGARGRCETFDGVAGPLGAVADRREGRGLYDLIDDDIGALVRVLGRGLRCHFARADRQSAVEAFMKAATRTVASERIHGSDMGVGLALGLPAAWGLADLIRAFLFQVRPHDLRVYLFRPAVLLAGGHPKPPGH